MTYTDAYRNQKASGWTRVDMVLELYSAAINALELAETAEHEGDMDTRTLSILRAQKLVIGIFAGIDESSNELTDQFRRLCHFVVRSIEDGDLSAARRVLVTLREGFEGIAEQARQLEQAGEIPALCEADAVNLTA